MKRELLPWNWTSASKDSVKSKNSELIILRSEELRKLRRLMFAACEISRFTSVMLHEEFPNMSAGEFNARKVSEYNWAAVRSFGLGKLFRPEKEESEIERELEEAIRMRERSVIVGSEEKSASRKKLERWISLKL